ncbi:hypothetical protein G7Z17_g2001 [Cylindrodendrum hubeiense]|uniref:Uncharacterized protein n=1 Tax=Cylindrodendrum hubeiense TaxID=595255 RepID=A0A9P5LEV8_9HYPO|nr:hypothetical protein G7Z17_g2001 [Cylindrodendrum hubeiense]
MDLQIETFWTSSSHSPIHERCWANVGNFFAQQGMVVVVANHQLVYYDPKANDADGVGENVSAKYPDGADDIQLTREWIYENISKREYGQGSPENVVLMGHSSGGAHIAMNLYAEVAGVIYLSVPFWYDREKPLRQKIIRRYYGSDAEDVWGMIRLYCNSTLASENSMELTFLLSDSSKIPIYIGTVKWEVKESCDATIDFFNAYRAKSIPAGTLPNFHVLDKHNHVTYDLWDNIDGICKQLMISSSNVLSIGTEDSVQAEKLLEFIRSCIPSLSSGSKL